MTALMDMIKAMCDAVMPRRTNAKRKAPVYWWSAALQQLQTECLRARMQAQRARGQPHHAQCIDTYRVKRAKFKNAISAAKANALKDLPASVDDDPWGIAYKVVRKKINATCGGTPQDPAALASIVSELFPSHDTLWQPALEPPASDFPSITSCEVTEAAKRIKTNKAPGIDGIPGVIVKAAATARPEVFRDTFQQCLLDEVFPKRWKTMCK